MQEIKYKLFMEKTFTDCSLTPPKVATPTNFAVKTFTDCALMPPKVATPTNFAVKTFANTHKTSKFAKVFSLESFLLYSITAR